MREVETYRVGGGCAGCADHMASMRHFRVFTEGMA